MRGARTSLAAASAIAINVGPNSAVSASDRCGRFQILDAVVDPGDLAGAVDPGRGADGVLGTPIRKVAFAGDPAIQCGDGTFRDIGAGDPRNGKREISLDATTHSGQQHPVEAGAVQRTCHDLPRPEDRARVACQHVVARGGTLVRLHERAASFVTV